MCAAHGRPQVPGGGGARPHANRGSEKLGRARHHVLHTCRHLCGMCSLPVVFTLLWGGGPPSPLRRSMCGGATPWRSCPGCGRARTASACCCWTAHPRWGDGARGGGCTRHMRMCRPVQGLHPPTALLTSMPASCLHRRPLPPPSLPPRQQEYLGYLKAAEPVLEPGAVVIADNAGVFAQVRRGRVSERRVERGSTHSARMPAALQALMPGPLLPAGSRRSSCCTWPM